MMTQIKSKQEIIPNQEKKQTETRLEFFCCLKEKERERTRTRKREEASGHVIPVGEQ